MSRARSVADLGNQNVLDLNANDGTLKVGAGVTIENTGEVQFAGIVTAATVQVGAATTLHSTGLDLGSGTLTCHNITSTGVLTYEDVTSVDSIGIITARSGIDVGTGTSISSPASNVLTLGTSDSERLRITSDGNILVSTATTITGNVGPNDRYLCLNAPSSSASQVVFSRDTNSDDYSLGGLRFANTNNSTDNISSTGQLVAAIFSRTKTSDSNAGDDSGAHLIFSTKSEGGNLDEKLRIDSSSTISIGNLVSPASANVHLDLYCNSSYDSFIRFRDESGAPGLIGFDHGSNAMHFYTDGASPAMSIDSSGRMGLGTLSPTAKLDIEGSSSAEIGMHINNTSGPTSILTSTGGSYGFAGVGANTSWLTTSGNTLAVGPYSSNSVLQFVNGGERMRLDANGRLGLANNNPSQLGTGTLVIGQGVSSETITIFTSATTNGNIHFADGTTGSDRYRGYVSYLHTTNTMSFGTDDVERLSLDANGDHYILPGTSNYGGALFIGENASPTGNLCARRDGNKRPLIYLGGKYPEITFAHTETSNTRHGSVIRFANYVASTNTAVGSQFVLGTNGTGTFFEIGYANAGQDINAHNGLDDYPAGSDGNQGIRIDNSGRVTKKNQPGFLARRTVVGDNRAAGAQEWTVGGTGSFNTGSHFNTTNGRFTAPVAGRYLFTSTPGYKQTSQDFNFHFDVNGSACVEPVRFIDGGDDLLSHSTSNGTVILNLAANDYVTVEIGQLHHANTGYNYFCGYLIG